MDQSKYIFYRASVPSRTATLSDVYRYELWRPSLLNPLPNGLKMNSRRFLLRTLMHAAHLFSNRDCGMLIVRRDGNIVHYSAFTGGWFRWPFMSADDVQIGDTWTAPHERGKGIALFALVTIMETLRRPGRNFWYFSRQDNLASCRVAQQGGMEMVGSGACFPVLKLNLLRQYRITDHSPDATTPGPAWPGATPPAKPA